MGKAQILDLGIGILSREFFNPFSLLSHLCLASARCPALLEMKELIIRPTLTKIDNSGRPLYGHNGGVWEWTSTPLAGYPGYVPSELYPGYSADFFDDKHYVVVCPFPTTPSIYLPLSSFLEGMIKDDR
jgi:hypothetical protein